MMEQNENGISENINEVGVPDSIQVGVINSYLDQNLVGLEYDDICEIGNDARNLRDFSNIVIGRLAGEISKRGGDKALGEFGRRLGLKLETLQQYRWVVSKFPDLKTYTGLSFSYYRIAAGTEDPQGWIQKAIDNGWTVTVLQQKIKNKPLMIECDHKDVEKIYIERCKDCGKKLVKSIIAV